MEKFEYTIYFNEVINVPKKSKKIFKYKFGNYKEKVKLYIKSSGAVLILTKGTKDFKLDNNLISNAVEKIFLYQLLNYKKTIDINKLIIQPLDIEEKVKYDSIIKKVDHNIKEIDNINTAISLYKRSDSSNYLISALTAYFIAQTKEKEDERLIYNWSTINGLYQTICINKNITKEFMQINEYKKFLENNKDEINVDKKIYNDLFYYEISKKEKEKISQNIINKSSNIKGNLDKIVIKELRNHKLNKVSPYLITLLDIPYYYRCKYIHAEKNISIIKNEYIIEKELNKILTNHIEMIMDYIAKYNNGNSKK